MMKKQFVIYTTLFLGNLVLGNLAYSQIDDSLMKQEAYNQAKKYATSIACMTTFDEYDDAEIFSDENDEDETFLDRTTLDNLYRIWYDAEYGSATYVVYWAGDMHCSGGSGTYDYHLTYLERRGDGYPFIVQEYEVSDNFDIQLKFIDSIAYNDGLMEIIGFEYDEKDGNCCPSLQYKYVIDFNEGKLKEKVRLN